MQRLVGDAFFRAMAAAFVSEELPASPLLLDYGEGFAPFIDAFEPADRLPYLGDVARLEWARQQAYHAADAEPLDPQRLAEVEPAQLGELRLLLHPSLRLCESRWPILDIWETNTRDAQPRRVDLDAGDQQLLVLRPRAQVNQQLLPAGAAGFLRQILAGRGLAESAQTAITDAETFDLAGLLQLLLQAGALIDFEPAAVAGGGNDHV